MVSRARSRAVPLVTLAVLSGCAASGPTALPPAGPVPDGHRQVTCEVRSAHGPVTLALALPAGFAPTRREGADCAWTAQVRVPVTSPDPTDALDRAEEVVTVRSTRQRSLEGERAAQQRFAVAGDVLGGDDSVLHLRLRRDVPTYAATVGDRLSWQCFCDGQDTLHRVVLADGVRLEWASVAALAERTDRELARTLRSAGTLGDAD